jgi:hypothetical protein
MSILDDLPDAIAEALDDVFRPAILLVPGNKVSDGQGGWKSGPAVEYPCKALVDDYSDMRRATASIPAHDRKIIILAASVAVQPAVGQAIRAEGRDWQIISLLRDPAAATWECQGR